MLHGIRTIFIPCTLRTAGSLNRSSDSLRSRVRTAHVMFVLLYSSLARTHNVLPLLLVPIFDVLSCVSGVPLTIQTIMPVVSLQWKVAVDPSVALTDVGMLTKPRMHKEHSKYNYLYLYNTLSILVFA